MRLTRYHEIAKNIASQIYDDTYLAGEKLPSIRDARELFAASKATIQRAYDELEDMGLIESRSRSGYYVKPHHPRTRIVSSDTTATSEPREISINKSVLSVFSQIQSPSLINFGIGYLHSDWLPLAAMQKILSRVARLHIKDCFRTNEFGLGDEVLRREVAKRAASAGCQISQNDIIITSGCQSAMITCLQAIAGPGDIIAIESPTFPGLLQAIENQGMKALEIPTDPNSGVILSELEKAIKHWPIKACAFIPSFHNPLGFSMSAKNKRSMVELLSKHEIPLIENDLFGDMNHFDTRTPPAKAFDKDGFVLYCSSVSKSLGSGWRVGWVSPGRYHNEISMIKAFRNPGPSTLDQIAMGTFFSSGSYDRHLRKLKSVLARQVQQVSKCIQDCFPEGTSISHPSGGFLLWVGLPNGMNAWKLFEAALEVNIAIVPGELFSITGEYRSYFRLSVSVPWNAKTESALRLLGKLAYELAADESIPVTKYRLPD